MNNRRVVVTGLGVIAPNGHGLDAYEKALREGKSGIRFQQYLQDLKFGCHVGGIPQNYEDVLNDYFTADTILALNEAMVFAGIAGMDAWRDAGLQLPDPADDTVYWDTGAIVGTGISGVDTLAKVIPKINDGKTRRLGSTIVEQTMSSAVSARMSGFLALGNQVTTNSSACSTGTEAIVMGYHRIKEGFAERMLCGGAESSAIYIWASFDAMKVLNTTMNDDPEHASRPMSASTAGFVPGSGAGLLMLESLESAQKRGARIYGEIIAGTVNCGGQRMGGSMSAPNSTGVQRCMRDAVEQAGIHPHEIDACNGHLTGTMADPLEINNWAVALERTPENFPLINSTKSMIGHCLGAAGGLESVAAVLELYKGFMHKSLNCEDLHEKIAPYEKSIVRETRDVEINILAKASFGFGDVNACVLYKKWRGE